MLRRPTRQQGFTLIEVSLAIVIGVVILAGGISLYNQTKLSAGNSKAQERVLALASLAEEMMASNPTQSYPDIANLSSLWFERRPDDAWASPWGGNAWAVARNAANTDGINRPNSAAVGAAYVAVAGDWTTAPANTGTTVNYGATQAAAVTAAPAAATYNNTGQTDKVGQFVYNRGPNWVSAYDPIDFEVHAHKNFICAIYTSRGDALGFIEGGK